MIKEKVLKNLIAFEKKNFPVTSAYFQSSNSTGNRKSHIVELKKMIRYKKNTTYFKQLSEDEQHSVLEDFDRILKWFRDEFDSSKFLSSICFSSQDAGLWQTINLKQPLKNELVIQPKPYIRPLTTLFSTYRNYAVVLVDKTKARIIESRLGKNIEHFYTENNSPESIKVGGFKGREERRVERNIHQAVIRHYKQIAQQIFDLNQKFNFNWIILGGRKETLSEFQKHLHDYVASKVQGKIYVEPSAALNDVLERVMLTEEKAREKFERNLLKELNDKKQINQGVEGIQAVLFAIGKNLIKTLIIQENYKTKGVFCRNSGYLGLSPSNKCPQANEQMERTNDIVEHLLHLCLAQGVNIEYIKASMSEFGNIAAILRYPISGS